MSLEYEIAHLVRQGMHNAGLRKEIEDLKAGNELLDQMLDKEMAKSAYLFECIERLEKAGDAMARIIAPPAHGPGEWDGEWESWNAAKQGKTSAWRPIETAPKDGTWVLCFVPDNCPEYENTLVLRYVIGSWGRPGIGGYRPTYWQPLPNPPPPTL